MRRRTQRLWNVSSFGAPFLFIWVVAYAQPWGALTNDHPIVIEHLIQLYNDLANQIASRNSADPGHANSRQEGSIRLFGVSATGYQILGEVVSAAKTRLDTVRQSQTQYINTLTSKTPPPVPSSVTASLNDFYQQQLMILHGVPIDLKKQLSPADWDGLEAFIATELVAKIKVSFATTPTFAPVPIKPPGTSQP